MTNVGGCECGVVAETATAALAFQLDAEQEMALDRVEFSWRARFPLAPLVSLRVHDWYRAGEGALEVRLHFDDAGDVVAASAKDRPRAVGKSAVETPFAGEVSNYEVLGGVRVPTRTEVRWDLPEGPFVYFRGQITEFELS